MEIKKEKKGVLGTVVEALPNTLFKVKMDDPVNDGGDELLAYLSGKMRMHRIRVLIGDRVSVEIDPYGGKGRISKRL